MHDPSDLPARIRRAARIEGQFRLRSGATATMLSQLTGYQTIFVRKQAKEYGDRAVCAIDREAGGRGAMADIDLELRSLFTKQDLDGL